MLKVLRLRDGAGMLLLPVLQIDEQQQLHI